MSLRLTKPGMSAALRHPKTGALVEPLGVLPSGKIVWPVLGASSDDPDDPAYTGEDDDPEADDEDDEEEDVKPPKKTKTKKVEDDEDEDDDEDDSHAHRASQQAKRYRLALRAEQRKTVDLAARLKTLEDEQKSPDEVAQRTIAELRDKAETTADTLRVMTAQLAFFKSNTIDWADPSDAFALAERAGLFDDLVDDDGTVDERELRRALKDLAKRKPHLVKKVEDEPKARGRKSTDADDEEEDDDDEPRSRRSAGTMNGQRKGTKKTADRAVLARRFPVLNKL